MKINSKVAKFQEGGAAPTPQEQGMAAPAGQPTGAPAPAGQPTGAPAPAAGPDAGGDPIMQLAQMAQQALQAGDGKLALAVCEGFLQLIQQMAGGAGGPQEAPQGEPVFKNGGLIVRRV